MDPHMHTGSDFLIWNPKRRKDRRSDLVCPGDTCVMNYFDCFWAFFVLLGLELSRCPLSCAVCGRLWMLQPDRTGKTNWSKNLITATRTVIEGLSCSYDNNFTFLAVKYVIIYTKKIPRLTSVALAFGNNKKKTCFFMRVFISILKLNIQNKYNDKTSIVKRRSIPQTARGGCCFGNDPSQPQYGKTFSSHRSMGTSGW